MALGELSDTSSADPDLFRPEGVVPFAISEIDARERAARWIRRTWFAPSKLSRSVRSDAFERLYYPLWLFDARAVGYWTSPGVMRGIVEMDFLNLAVSAHRAADRNGPTELEASAIRRMRPYAPREIGMSPVADARRGLGEATAISHAWMERQLAAAAKRSRPKKEREKINLTSVEYARESSRRLLLPLWSLDYRHLGHTYRITVDGATGKVVGEAPKSFAKAALVTLVLLWLILLLGDADTALSIPQRMAEGMRWLLRRSPSG